MDSFERDAGADLHRSNPFEKCEKYVSVFTTRDRRAYRKTRTEKQIQIIERKCVIL